MLANFDKLISLAISQASARLHSSSSKGMAIHEAGVVLNAHRSLGKQAKDLSQSVCQGVLSGEVRAQLLCADPSLRHDLF
jgi:hypothetical protein